MPNNFKIKIRGLLTAALLPLAVFAITEVLSLIIFGKHLFVSAVDVNNFLRSVGITLLSSYALAINMTAGRMDLSLGGQQLIGCLVGGNLAISLGFGVFGTLVLCIVFAALAGLLSGVVFVTLRLPTFVTGIGMALIFEALSNAYAPEGLMVFGNEKLSLLSNTMFIFIVAIAVAAAVHFLLTHSTFGMHYNAIKGGLRVSMNSGIPINANVLASFALCGALIGLSGILQTGYSSYMAPGLNMSSISSVFAGFTPVFLALFMQSFCPLTIGILLASIAFKLLGIFLLKFTMPSQAATAITMMILLALLVLMALMRREELNKKYKARSTEA